MALFLTDEELFDLTGYRRNADRCRWLSENGWTFLRSAVTGRPVVSRNYAESRMAGTPVKIEPKLKMISIRR